MHNVCLNYLQIWKETEKNNFETIREIWIRWIGCYVILTNMNFVKKQ